MGGSPRLRVGGCSSAFRTALFAARRARHVALALSLRVSSVRRVGRPRGSASVCAEVAQDPTTKGHGVALT